MCPSQFNSALDSLQWHRCLLVSSKRSPPGQVVFSGRVVHAVEQEMSSEWKV